MDYFDFADAVFSDQPDVLALRLSLVQRESGTEQESNRVWIVRDSDEALCLVGGVAERWGGRLTEWAQSIADRQATDALRLVAEKTTAAEELRIPRCDPALAQDLRARFLRVGVHWISYDLEAGAAPPESVGPGEQDLDSVAVWVFTAGHLLGPAFDRSVWLTVVCRRGEAAFDEETLFRYLARYYPFELQGTPFHLWGREFGDRYGIGLPQVHRSLQGARGPGVPASGKPDQPLFWGKDRNRLLPDWKETCGARIEALSADIDQRLRELDARSGSKICATRLIEWLDGKTKAAAGSEDACATLLCAGRALAQPDLLWLPLLSYLWRWEILAKSADFDGALARFLGAELTDPWRKCVPAAHAGYVIQGVLELRDSLSSAAAGLIAETVRYQPAEKKIVQSIELSGIDKVAAKALLTDLNALGAGDNGELRERPWRAPRLGIPVGLTRALDNMTDVRRGGMGNVEAAYRSEVSMLRIRLLFPLLLLD